MRNMLSLRDPQRAELHSCLHSIWHVDADSSYLITWKKRLDDCAYIAVRTISGHGWISIDGQDDLHVSAGSLVILRTITVSAYGTDGDRWEFYWFKFDMTAGQPEDIGIVHSIRLSAQELADLERCFTGLSAGAQAETRRADALFNYLLADWLLRTSPHASGTLAAEELISLLEKGRREQHSIAEIARSAGMCERSFRSAVHQATGLSPKAYMIRSDMLAAMELLRTSSMSISEIAACLNYADPLYFSRTFRKYYGVSPQHVRNGMEL